MAQHRTKEQLIKDSLKAIDKNKLFFVTDVAPMIGISVSRFYQLELEKVELIKDALVENRVKIKSSMRKKWYDSDQPSLQIGLYKLIGDEEEYHRLANTKIDITSREEQPIFKGIDLTDAIKPRQDDETEQD